jgi:hypothetical protein
VFALAAFAIIVLADRHDGALSFPYYVLVFVLLVSASVIGFLDEPSEFSIEYGKVKFKDKLRKYYSYGKHARYKTCYLSVYNARCITFKLLDKYKNIGVITIIGDAYAEDNNGEDVGDKVIVPRKIEFYGVECFYEASEELKKTFPNAEIIEKN